MHFGVIFLFLLFNFCILKTQAFKQRGYEIRDLIETDLALFQKEVEQWRIFDPASDAGITKISAPDNRSSEFIFGGPNILKYFDSEVPTQFPYFQRTYTNLPPHTYATIIGKFWYFGSFQFARFINIVMEPKERYQTFIRNGEFVHRKVSEYPLKIQTKVNEIQNIENDFETMKFGMKHDNTELVLKILSQAHDEMEISFGFRELTIHFSNSSGKPELPQVSCQVSTKESSTNKCHCPLDQFLDQKRHCQNCFSNCDACFGSSPSECLSCSPGTHWVGTECSTCHIKCKTCSGPTEHECIACNFGFYKFDNGSCQEACKWPLRPVWTGNDYQCIKACQQGEYGWSLNNTCIKSCEPPLVNFKEHGVTICKNPCSDHEFLFANGSCSTNCPGPLLAEWNFDRMRFCKNPCEGKSQYLYWNRSCLESCPAPLQVKSDPGVKYCKNPCSHNPQFYVYNNGSCLSTCRSPLKTKFESGVKYCLSPCQLTGEYILKDGSCSAECPSPLIQRNEAGVGTSCLSPCESPDYFIANHNGSLCLLSCPNSFETRIRYGVKFCLSPCLTDQYYFEKNNSCLNACPYPLKVRSEADTSFCDNPCSADFIYDDQSCHKTCLAPLINITDPGKMINYCKTPCSGEGNKKYLMIDGDCQENCEYPYSVLKKGPYQVCLIDASPSQIDQVNSMRHTVRISNAMSEIGGLLSTLIDAGDPTSIFIIPLLKMLETIKYTEIPLPVNIVLILNEGNSEFTDLRHNLLIMGIICLLIILLAGIKVLVKPQSGSKLFLVLDHCSFALQWNVSAAIVISLNGNAILYLLTQSDKLRISICLVVILLTTFIGYKIIQISSEVKSIRERHLKEGQEQYLEASLLGFRRWKFIFEIYKSENIPQRLFVLIYVIRIILVNLAIRCLSEYPLVQSISMTIISFGMLFYLIWGSPIQKKMSYIQHIAIEISLLLYNILLVILAVQENDENLGVIGQLMMILYLITPIATAILIGGKIFYNLYSIYGSKIELSKGIIQLEMKSPKDAEVDESENVVEAVSFETNLAE